LFGALLAASMARSSWARVAVNTSSDASRAIETGGPKTKTTRANGSGRNARSQLGKRIAGAPAMPIGRIGRPVARPAATGPGLHTRAGPRGPSQRIPTDWPSRAASSIPRIASGQSRELDPRGDGPKPSRCSTASMRSPSRDRLTGIPARELRK
jgi:hypothetical protein